MTTDIHLQTLEKAGMFKPVDTTVYPRVIMAATGLPKQGKTHFMLSAPGPIGLFDVDYGLEGVVHKFPGKEIYAYRVPMPDPKGQTMAEHFAEYEKIDAGMDLLLANPAIRTIAMDTGTEIWEIVRLGYLGKLEKVMSKEYGPANGAMRRLLKKVLDSDKNFVLVQKMKPEYKKNEATGNYVMAGFNDIAGIVQVIVRPFYAEEDEELPDGQMIEAGQFGVHIMSSRHNPNLNGTYYVGAMATFPMIAAVVVPGTTPSMFM